MPSRPENLQWTVDGTDVELTWEASTSKYGVKGYRGYRNGVLVASNITGTAYTHVNNPSGEWATFWVTAVDNRNNEGPAAIAVVEAMQEPEPEPEPQPVAPDPPTSLTLVDRGETWIEFSFTPGTTNDDLPVLGHRIYVGGALAGTTSTSTYKALGLTAETEYSIRAASYTNQLESVLSDALVVSTLASGDPEPEPEPEPDPPDTTPPDAPTVQVVLSGVNRQVSWNQVEPDLTFVAYRKEGAHNDSIEGFTYWTFTTGLSLTDTRTVDPGVYSYAIRALDEAGSLSDPGFASIEVEASSEWISTDIGSPALAGSFTEGEQLTVQGAGYDIWYARDELHYAYRHLIGDFRIEADMLSLTNTDPWAKAGVMFRGSVAEDSAFCMMIATPTTTNGVSFQYRASDGIAAQPSGSAIPGHALPIRLALQRVGNVITGYTAPIGTSTWTLRGTRTMSLPTECLVGLAVTSHNTGELATAVFDNVTAAVLPPDETAPSVPTGLAGTAISSSQISASCNASTDAQAGVAGYRFYLDGSLAADVQGTSTTLNGLTAETTYDLQVSAYDHAGNESAKTTAVEVTTPAAASQGPYQTQPISDFIYAEGVAKSEDINLGEHFTSPQGLPLTYDFAEEPSLPSGVTATIDGDILTREATDSATVATVTGIQIVATEGSVTDPDPPDEDTAWATQSSGAMVKNRFDTFADVDNWIMRNSGYTANLFAWDETVALSGNGSLRLDIRDDHGAIAGDWSTYIDGAGAKRYYQAGDEFWFQYCVRFNDPFIRHYMRTSGASSSPKISIIDRFRRTTSPREIVLHNHASRGYPGVYIGLGTGAYAGGVQRYESSLSDYYQHGQFDAGSPESPSNTAERMARYGPLRYASNGNSYQGPTVLAANIPDTRSGSIYWEPGKWYVVTQRVKINSVSGANGIYQLWVGEWGAAPKKLIAISDVNWRCDVPESKDVDDTTPGNLGFNGIHLTTFQTDLMADPGRATMSVWYDRVLTSESAIQHFGSAGLDDLPGIL